jgi:hypothetical protein
MIISMSWQGYWTFLATIVVLYYLFVVIFFYAADLKRWLKVQAMPSAPSTPTGARVAAQTLTDPPGVSVETVQPATALDEGEEGLPLPVQALVDEIQAFMAGAADRHLPKASILESLSSLVQKYPGLSHSPYRGGLDEILQFTAEHICSIHLSADEVLRVWEG